MNPSLIPAKKGKLQTSSSFYLGILFFICYLLGEAFPDYFWASHSSSFIDGFWKYATFFGALSFLTLGLYPSLVQQIVVSIETRNYSSLTAIKWSLSLLMGFLFYYFPMVADFYGEAYLLNPQMSQTVTKVSDSAYHDFFSFGLNPWAGQKTVFALITYLAYYTGETLYTVIRCFDAFFGFCFILTWFNFIDKQLNSITWKFILTVAVCSAPFLLNFYGHLEMNAIVLWINLLWLTQLIHYLDKKSILSLWSLFLILLVALKIHGIAVLFTPVWLYCAFNYYFEKLDITWEKVGYYLLMPVFIIGIISYFFIFKDYNDPRYLNYTVKEYDRLFLPILSPEAPLDRYNLFSFNHIFDYFSEFLLWSPIALLLLIVIFISHRKSINWRREEIILSSTTLILFVSFFFMLNPLLSMQMDWDLFSFPTPVLLVLVVLLTKQIEEKGLKFKILPISLAIVLLNIPFFTVHFSNLQLSKKLESLGIRIYHTYYDWSSQTIHNGLSLLSQNRDYQIERKNVLLYKLMDSAVEGKDREYGLLWRKDGAHFLDYHKDASRAYVYLEKANLYYPTDNYTKLLLMESCLLLDQNEQAYDLSLQLKKDNYPQAQIASTTSVQTALFAEKYNEAYSFSSEHLLQWSSDTTMRTINTRLKNGIQVDKLKDLFYVPKDLFKKK